MIGLGFPAPTNELAVNEVKDFDLHRLCSRYITALCGMNGGEGTKNHAVRHRFFRIAERGADAVQ